LLFDKTVEEEAEARREFALWGGSAPKDESQRWGNRVTKQTIETEQEPREKDRYSQTDRMQRSG